MSDFKLGYQKAFGTRYDGRIKKIVPSKDKLRPIYEAFINAYEAIKNISEGRITVSIQVHTVLFSEKPEDLEFDNITITDNGVGFNDEEFTRFLNLDDTSKGLGSKGSGRIQFVHYFEKAEYESVFEDTSSSTGYKKRIFTLSKSDSFLKNNAIVRLDVEKDIAATNSYTVLKLSNPLESSTQKQENREFFKLLSVQDLKENVKSKFLALFCNNRNNLPEIMLQKTINGVIDVEKSITRQDIPDIYKSEDVNVKQKQIEIASLRDMFLLNDETIKRAKIKPTDDEAIALKKIYEADSKLVAKKDIEIKRRIDALNRLTPNSSDYQEKLNNEVKELVKIIPLQNRTSLTQYIARRKMVLELFQKTLDCELDKFKNGGQIDEKILHNLIFQQFSNDPEKSDLWLINEDFIYFKGTSESMLKNIKYEDDFILKREDAVSDKDKLSDEEKLYCAKTGGNDKQRRTYILLFPKEEKCIIIELKAPDADVSEHLNQINRYASLINNLSKDKYNFRAYYGYLIGENIDIDAIEDNDTDFISAHSLNYIFRPYKRIAGKFGKDNGSLYTEIIKYSTLLERARLRNKIFIDKLEQC
jgi:hypothetical protein